jgi:hypothetical protein
MLPYIKLFGQVAAAVSTILLGGPKWEVGHPFLSVGLTIFWYVAVMNAFNMMDNMDGAAGSIALPLLVGGSWLLGGESGIVYGALAAAVAAFLLRNWHPSAFYMGDNGSQLMGFVLGYMGLSILGKYPQPFWVGLVSLVALYSLLAGDTFLGYCEPASSGTESADRRHRPSDTSFSAERPSAGAGSGASHGGADASDWWYGLLVALWDFPFPACDKPYRDRGSGAFSGGYSFARLLCRVALFSGRGGPVTILYWRYFFTPPGGWGKSRGLYLAQSWHHQGYPVWGTCQRLVLSRCSPPSIGEAAGVSHKRGYPYHLVPNALSPASVSPESTLELCALYDF